MSVATVEITAVGQPVPDFTLPSYSGTNIHLADYKGKQNVVLFFMREFRCPSCIAYSRQLAVHYPAIQGQNTEVLVLGLGGDALAGQLAKQISAPFPVLYDREGAVYDQFRLDRALFSTIQRSAAFVIDAQGIIRYTHRVTLATEWQRPNSLTDMLATLNVKPKPEAITQTKHRRWLFG